MTIRCYTPETGWKNVNSTDLYDSTKGVWIERKDGEFVFTNEDRLNVNCNELRVHLKNGSWTFISELEIVSDAIVPIRSTPSQPLKPPTTNTTSTVRATSAATSTALLTTSQAVGVSPSLKNVSGRLQAK